MLGERLKALRAARGLTMEAAGKRAGLSSRTVSRAERGENPTLQTIVRLLRVYDKLSGLDQFIPEPAVSPMALIREQRRSGG